MKKRNLNVIVFLFLVMFVFGFQNAYAFFVYKKPAEVVDSNKLQKTKEEQEKKSLSKEFIKKKKEFVSQYASKCNGYLYQIGEPQPVAKKMVSKKSPLFLSMNLVVPKNWEYFLTDDIKDKEIALHFLGYWPDALKQIAQKQDSCFVIDWENKNVYGDSYYKKGIWKIEKGDLKEQLQKWAKKADYWLIWEREDPIRISKGVELKGSFLDAFLWISQKLNKQGVDLKIKAIKDEKMIYVE